MQRLFLKFFYVIAAIRYPAYRPELRYFVRDNYFARFSQFRYGVADYWRKKPYKVIDFGGEFEHELRYILPFAYWHHLNGTLQQTISCQNTKPFYFFSTNHTERYDKRVWTAGYGVYNIPNMTHAPTFDYSKWAPVPFKKHYQNDRFVYDKPLLVIANKYNIEWDGPPVNYVDIPTLDLLIKACRSHYQIVYNRPQPGEIVLDNSEIMDLNEHDWLRRTHPDVLLMSDLFDRHRDTVSTFNELQLLVYANCDRFVSVHGGTAALASYFGGTNILLSVPGGGFEHDFNEYTTIFPALSGATIHHARNRDELVEFVRTDYLANAS